MADKCRLKKTSVSVASIKRAEAGKNVLYRTAINLAEFFDVPVEELVDRALPSLHSIQERSVQFGEKYRCVLLGVQLRRCRASVDIVKKLAGAHRTVYLVENNVAVCFSSHEIVVDDLKNVFHFSNGLKSLFDCDFKVCIQVAEGGKVLNNTFTNSCFNAIRLSGRFCIKPYSRYTDKMHLGLELASWGEILACPCITTAGFFQPVANRPPSRGLGDWCVVMQPDDNVVGANVTGKSVRLCWELHQLQLCYDAVLEERRGRVAYISAPSGIGKTHLAEIFLATAKGGSKGVLVDSSNLSKCFISLSIADVITYGGCLFQCVIRRWLGLGLDASDKLIRSTVAAFSALPSSPVTLLWMAGVRLLSAERGLLDALDVTRREEVLKDTIRRLIQYSSQRLTPILVIDDLHLADDSLKQDVKLILGEVDAHPLFLLFCARNIARLTSPPHWLERAYIIEPRGLTCGGAKELVRDLGIHHLDSSSIDVAVTRAEGHPRLLSQLVLSCDPATSIPVALNYTVVAQMDKLPFAELLGLKIAASFGPCFSAGQIQFGLWRFHGGQLMCQLQVLVTAGFIKHQADGYSFQHRLIQEAVVNNMLGGEKRKLHAICQAWHRDHEYPSQASPEEVMAVGTRFQY